MDHDAPGRYQFSFEEQSPYANTIRLIDAHTSKAPGVVVDIGCGFGAIAEPLRDRGYDYIGVDTRDDGLADLQGRGFETLAADLGDVDALLACLDGALHGRSLVAITALDVIEHLTKGDVLLATLHSFATVYPAAILVVSIPNVTHIDLGAKLLLGRWDVTPTGLLDDTHVALYSPARMDKAFSNVGFELIEALDFDLERSDQFFPADAAALRSEAPLGEFLRRIRSSAAPSATTNQFVRAYRPVEVSAASSDENLVEHTPYLSVLVPLEPTDLFMFEDLLLTLDAQTCQDFELLILVDEGMDQQALRSLVDQFDEVLAPKTRIMGGGPIVAERLNSALGSAVGRYVAVVRPSVVLFSRWAEIFAQLVQRAPGAVVRAGAAEQRARRVDWANGELGHEATEGPRQPWPTNFVALEQLIRQSSPAGSFALPMSSLADLGLRFADREVFDRELFLRASLLCGVEDFDEEITSIHRSFGAESSEVDGVRFLEATANELDGEPLLLPPGTVSALASLLRDPMEGHGDSERVSPQSPTTPAADELADMKLLQANRELEALCVELDEMRSSTSWRVTGPLRKITRALRMMARRA